MWKGDAAKKIGIYFSASTVVRVVCVLVYIPEMWLWRKEMHVGVHSEEFVT